MTLATSLERVVFRTNESTAGDCIAMLRSHRAHIILPAEPILEKDFVIDAHVYASGARQDLCGEFSPAVELIAADLAFDLGIGAEATGDHTSFALAINDGIGGAWGALDTLTNIAAFVARVPKDFTIVPATDRIIAGGQIGLTITDATAGAGTNAPRGLMHVLAHQLDYSAELVLMEAERDMHLVAIGVTPRITVPLDAANYVTLDVGVANGAGGAPASFDTLTTAAAALTARTTRTFAAIVPATDAVPQGSNLVLTITKAGTGVWLPELAIDIYYTND